MKKEMIVVLIIASMIFGVWGGVGVFGQTAHSCSSSDQVIMKLQEPINSLGTTYNGDALTPGESFDYDICYDEIFDDEYIVRTTSPHDCSGRTNQVLWLSNEWYASTPEQSGDITICYGDLDCTAREACIGQEEEVLGLYEETNSLIFEVDYNVPNMISWWRFDETSGDDASDFIGSHDGKIYGASSVEGKVRGALSFDGQCDDADGCDYVSILHHDDFDITDEITMEAWIKPASVSHPGIIINKGNKWGMTLNTDNKVYVDLPGLDKAKRKDYPCVPYYIRTESSITQDWTHVVVIYDGSDIKIYIDGELDAETSVTGKLDKDLLSLPLFIGANSENADSKCETNDPFIFNGVIDEVAVYNRALDEDEITHRYNLGLDQKKICCLSNNEAPTVYKEAEILGPDDRQIYFKDEVLTFSQTSGGGVGLSCIWHFGDGETSTNFQTTHDYSSPGQKNIVLELEENGEVISTDRISILIVDSPGVLAYINEPAWGDVYGSNVDFDATGSYGVDRKEDKTIECKFGTCPAVTKGCDKDLSSCAGNLGEGCNEGCHVVVSGTPAGFGNLGGDVQFNWKFDGTESPENKNKVEFSKSFENIGTHTAELSINYKMGEATGTTTTEFITISAEQIEFCWDYPDEDSCNAAPDKIERHSIDWLVRQEGKYEGDEEYCSYGFGTKGTGNWEIVENCRCEWENGECTAQYDFSSGRGGEETNDETCKFRTEVDGDCSVVGRESITVSWTATWTGNELDKPEECADGEKKYDCVDMMKLGFFSWFSFVAVIIIIIIIYILIKNRKK